MKVQKLLEAKLNEGLSPQFMDVINESPQHSVPSGSESHFRVILVSDKFQDMPMVKRQKLVFSLIKEELKANVHAFSQHTFTPSEWLERGGSLPSPPPCVGGKKKEKPV